jgi:hypothetical protein
MGDGPLVEDSVRRRFHDKIPAIHQQFIDANIAWKVFAEQGTANPMTGSNHESIQRWVRFGLLCYFSIAALEGFFALRALLGVPADPKNAWLWGFSRNRILMAVAILAALLFFLGLALRTWRDSPRLSRFAGWLGASLNGVWIYGLSCGAALIVFVAAPYLYLYFQTQPVWMQRLAPFIFWAGALYFQTLIFVIWLYIFVRANGESSQVVGAHRSRMNPAKVAAILATVVVILVVANVTSYVLRNTRWELLFQQYFVTFNLDREHNIPTYFSALQLLFAAGLLALIAAGKFKAQGRFARSWAALALIFIFLAVDEVMTLHEQLAGPIGEAVQASPLLNFFPWLIAAIPLVLVFAAVYTRFLLHLPRKTLLLVALAGIMYVLGAIGFELMGGWYTLNFGVSKQMRFVIYTVEETFEMLAIVVFVYGLLDYMQSQPEIATFMRQTFGISISQKADQLAEI